MKFIVLLEFTFLFNSAISFMKVWALYLKIQKQNETPRHSCVKAPQWASGVLKNSVNWNFHIIVTVIVGIFVATLDIHLVKTFVDSLGTDCSEMRPSAMKGH